MSAVVQERTPKPVLLDKDQTGIDHIAICKRVSSKLEEAKPAARAVRAVHLASEKRAQTYLVL
ncbi:hypothetical protein V5279_35990 [Bradyrhizobium sp. 26S5]|uniref:hypothetical protein n=1 Tax=Bradyrhizobium sp. 26S5 TaxID=3139729 RepID=UPI0030CE6277